PTSATTGKFEWTVTGPLSTIARVRVETVPARADMPGFFTIGQPFSPGPAVLITTGSGSGSPDYDGELPPLRAGQDPSFVPLDPFASLHVGDLRNHRVRLVDPWGSALTTAVGDGTDASGGDDGPGPSAQIRAPRAGVVGGFGDLYIADEAAAVIRRFSMSDGLVTTVAGNGD